MAITTYATLQTAIAAWLGRTDMTAVIPDFIQLAEEEIAAMLRSQVVRDSLTITSGDDSVALPAACAELRSIRFDTATRKYPLDISTDVNLATLRRAGSGVPSTAAVVDGTILFDVTADSDYVMEIVYFDKLTPLSDDAATNGVLDASARIYLYGALVEAETYLEHDERVVLWSAKFQKAIQDENLARERAELGAAPTVRRLPVVF